MAIVLAYIHVSTFNIFIDFIFKYANLYQTGKKTKKNVG